MSPFLFFAHPDESVFEDRGQTAMDGVADVFDGDPVPHDDPVLEVGGVPGLLGVHPDQVQVLPQFVAQVVQIQFHFATAKRK